MAYNVIEGSAIRFYTSTPFTSIGGVVVDPDIVTFKWQVQGQAETTYTYTNPTGDPTGHIVRDAAGTYHVDLSTVSMPGIWEWAWGCQPSSGTDVTATQVVDEGSVVVSASEL